MQDSFDIVVAGGGTAGVVAAIQSARAGARTLLVERNALPGGTMTAGGIAYPGLFFAWRQQVIAGIGWELVSEAAAESGIPLPDFASQIGMEEHFKYQVRLNPVVYSALCDEKMLAAGVKILYHTMIAAACPQEDGIELQLCTLEGLRTVRARRVIDCTGDASLCSLAGCEVIHPAECQPATLCCRLGGYRDEALDAVALRAAADRAVADGLLRWNDLGWNRDSMMQMLRCHGDNANHIFPELPPHTAEGRSALEIEARRSLLRAWRFLRVQPGLEHLDCEFGAFECGVRESAVIRGEATVTGVDYVSGRRYPDAVCNAFYPVDLHGRDGVAPMKIRDGVVPQVPLGALVPRGSGAIFAAGRCVSSDRAANSALRVQAVCMATAQAAAAAAVVSIRRETPAHAVPVPAVRSLLKEHGAILPEPA